MRILFHDNSLSVRGTTVAVFDYAYFLQKDGFEVGVTFNAANASNDASTVLKFKKEFDFVKAYQGSSDDIIDEFKPDAFFMEKGGPFDGIISRRSLNWVHAISPCRPEQVYGDKFAMGSRWLSEVSDLPYVPYMVNLPEIKGNLRSDLGIPNDLVVFGRNGGFDSFDLSFVKQAVIDVLKVRSDIVFLFQGTEQFAWHDRVIHLPPDANLEYKVRFINTCDALLHARHIGESFGLTCAEFSSKGKPVITWFGSQERNHISELRSKGIYYDGYADVFEILMGFQPIECETLKCYHESHPDAVMKKFKEVYLNA